MVQDRAILTMADQLLFCHCKNSSIKSCQSGSLVAIVFHLTRWQR